VPAENVIGEPGEGLKIALTTLNTGRLTMPGTSAALGKACVHFAQDWANKRIQWGAPVGKHEAVGKKLASIASNTFAMESMNTVACRFVDKGQADIRLEAAMAKLFCTTKSWEAADDFLQVRGGRGYETVQSLLGRGEEPVPTERMLRDARISRIIEGTDEIMRLFIAREAMDTHMRRVMPIIGGKGAMMSQVFKAFGDQKKRKILWDALKFYAGWYPRMWLPSGGALSSQYLSTANRRHLTYIPKMSKRLARTMFHTMAKFGPALERRQLILHRFVDIGTDLFAMASTLANAEYLLSKNPENRELQELVDLFCRDARTRIATNMREVKHNYDRVRSSVNKAFMGGSYAWLAEGAYTDTPPCMRVAASDRAEEKVEEPDEEGKEEAPVEESVPK